jgi:pimeloyl-ACP methyl ester carboxylesterase
VTGGPRLTGGVRFAVVVALAGMALLAVSCAGDDEASPFDTTTTSPPSSGPTTHGPTATATTTSTEPAPPPTLEWEDCGGADCATLVVPLDHGDPDGATIELAVARRPAGEPDERLGVVLVNPGGPGGSGVDLLASGFSLGGSLDDRFDLVSWDPRGVGGSTAVRCGGEPLDRWLGTDPAPDDAAETTTLHENARALAEACTEADGDLLAHVSTTETVEDLDDLRAALGEDTIGYLGLSYGTLIGQLYLEAHPDRVRAMVLDGVMDPADALPQLADAQAGGFESAFENMAEACASDGCAVDDPLAAYDELAERVEVTPLPSSIGDDIGPAELQVGVESALYSAESWPLLARGLLEGLSGDGTIIGSFVEAYYSSASFTAYASVVCLDFGPPDRAGFDELAVELAERHDRFGEGLAYELLPCAYWPVPPVRPPEPVVHPDGGPPVLLVGTQGDPATPISEARDVAERLEGRLLELDGEGHVAIHTSSCVDGWIEAYLLDLTLPPEGTVCT